MNLLSSLRSAAQILQEDASLTRLGVPRGWLLCLHYQGRWAERCQSSAPLKKAVLNVCGTKVNLVLSALYEGAFKGVFLDGEYVCGHLLPNAPSRILDLGANIGMGAVHLNAQFPGAEFICVEPDERNLSLLKVNLEGNQVRARVLPAAAGAQAGTLRLRYGRNPTCSALETSTMHELAECMPVNMITVTEILDAAGWENVDLVKIDIEGTEDELLSINHEWLHRVGALILEIHPNTSAERIASYLSPFGFQLRRVGSGREPVYFATR